MDDVINLTFDLDITLVSNMYKVLQLSLAHVRMTGLYNY